MSLVLKVRSALKGENYLDDYWRDRITNSVKYVCDTYNVDGEDVHVYIKDLDPREISIVNVEELSVEEATDIYKRFHGKNTPPVSVVECGYKKVLYMGHARSLQFCLTKKPVRAVVMRLPYSIPEPPRFSWIDGNLEQHYLRLEKDLLKRIGEHEFLEKNNFKS